MKKVVLTIALAATAGWACADDVLRVATDGTYPPFSEMDANGEMSGFDIDIANALCAQMNKTCEIKQIEWDGLIPALKTRKVDALVASMNANDERRKSVSFTDPYYVNPGIFVRHKGTDIELTPALLQGKVLGVLRASIFDDYATKELADTGVEIKRYSSQDEANLDAESGRVDILFADKLVLDDGFLNREEGKDFEQFGPEVNDETYFGEGISIAVRKDDQALVDEFNAALKAIKANGEYQKINAKYFAVDISGDAPADNDSK